MTAVPAAQNRGAAEHVLVVGAGLGGLRTIERLRAAGHGGRISLIGRETRLPYDRPPLTKQILTGEWDAARAALCDEAALTTLDVRAYLGREVSTVRCSSGAPFAVDSSDGLSLEGDALVIATGVDARRLPGQPAGVGVLRSLDDALALKNALATARTLVVVGGGFIGAEVASAAVARGIMVTVLETLRTPAERAFGPVVGELAGRLMTEAGVSLRTGVLTAGFVDGGVVLDDGRVVTAEVVLVGIGGTPKLDFMPRTGDGGGPLDLTDGVTCGSTGQVVGLSGAWAVGDVARWDGQRDEHWTSTGEQAAIVAKDILNLPIQNEDRALPYVWSDQFGLRLQVLGRPHPEGRVVELAGKGLSGGPVRGTVAGYLDPDGRLVGVAGFGAAREVGRHRASIGTGLHQR